MWIGLALFALFVGALASRSGLAAPKPVLLAPPGGARVWQRDDQYVASVRIPSLRWSCVPGVAGRPTGDEAFDQLFGVQGDLVLALCDLAPSVRAQLIQLALFKPTIHGGAVSIVGPAGLWEPALAASLVGVADALKASTAAPLETVLRARFVSETHPAVRLELLRALLARCRDVAFVEREVDQVAGARQALRLAFAIAAEDRRALLATVSDRFERDADRLAALAALRPARLDELGDAAVAVVDEGLCVELMNRLANLGAAGVPDPVLAAARRRLDGPVAVACARLVAAGRRDGDQVLVAEHLALLPVAELPGVIAWLGLTAPPSVTGLLRRLERSGRLDSATRSVLHLALDDLKQRSPGVQGGEISVAAPEGATLSRAEGHGDISRLG